MRLPTLAGLVAAAVALPVASLTAQETAREIVDRVDKLLRGASSEGTMEMEVVTVQ